MLYHLAALAQLAFATTHLEQMFPEAEVRRVTFADTRTYASYRICCVTGRDSTKTNDVEKTLYAHHAAMGRQGSINDQTWMAVQMFEDPDAVAPGTPFPKERVNAPLSDMGKKGTWVVEIAVANEEAGVKYTQEQMAMKLINRQTVKAFKCNLEKRLGRELEALEPRWSNDQLIRWEMTPNFDLGRVFSAGFPAAPTMDEMTCIKDPSTGDLVPKFPEPKSTPTPAPEPKSTPTPAQPKSTPTPAALGAAPEVKTGLSGGAIAGIVVGSLFGLMCLCTLCYCCCAATILAMVMPSSDE